MRFVVFVWIFYYLLLYVGKFITCVFCLFVCHLIFSASRLSYFFLFLGLSEESNTNFKHCESFLKLLSIFSNNLKRYQHEGSLALNNNIIIQLDQNYILTTIYIGLI